MECLKEIKIYFMGKKLAAFNFNSDKINYVEVTRSPPKVFQLLYGGHIDIPRCALCLVFFLYKRKAILVSLSLTLTLVNLLHVQK